MPKIADFYAELGLKKDKYDKGMKDAEKAPSKLGEAFKGFASGVAAAFSVGAIIGFTKEIINTTAEFQKFKAVLTNTLGSGALADKYLKQITKFAADTPFSVIQITDAFVKLTNQGFLPSQKEMTKLGDLASSTGKSFDQLAEAIIDASTGQFERLKEFGIKASVNGDKVAFSFKNITTEVDNTGAAIRQYILGLGDLKGVTGSMAAISETLGGKISNLGDAWGQFLIVIGNTKGPLKETIEATSTTLTDLTNVLDSELPKLEKFFALFAMSITREYLASDEYYKRIGKYIPKEIKDRIENIDKIQAETRATFALVDALKVSNAEKIKELKKANKKQALKDLKEEIKLQKELAETLRASVPTIGTINDLFAEYYKPRRKDGFPAFDPGDTDEKEGFFDDFDGIDTEKIKEKLDDATQMYKDFIKNIQSMAEDFLAGAISSLAEGIGEAIGSGEGLQSVFTNILGIFGSFLKQMGAMMVTYGIAQLALFESWKLGPAGAIALIAAGAALGVIGGMMTGAASKMAQGGGSTAGMSGGGNGTVGGYNYGGNQGGALVAEVSGDSLRFILERNIRNYGRIR